MSSNDLNIMITMNPYRMSLDVCIWREGYRVVSIPSAMDQDYSMSSTSNKAAVLHEILKDYMDAYDYIIHGAGGWMPNLAISMEVLTQTQAYLQETK